MAVVERDDSVGEDVTVRPVRAGAVPASWIDLGVELQFYVGIRGRWELGRSLDGRRRTFAPYA